MEFVYVFLSSDKKNEIWAKPNPNSSYIMYIVIGLQCVMMLPPKKVL